MWPKRKILHVAHVVFLMCSAGLERKLHEGRCLFGSQLYPWHPEQHLNEQVSQWVCEAGGEFKEAGGPTWADRNNSWTPWVRVESRNNTGSFPKSSGWGDWDQVRRGICSGGHRLKQSRAPKRECFGGINTADVMTDTASVMCRRGNGGWSPTKHISNPCSFSWIPYLPQAM